MDHSDSQKNQKFVNFTSFSDNLSHHPPSKRMGFDDVLDVLRTGTRSTPGNVKAQLQMISPCVILADNFHKTQRCSRSWFPNDPIVYSQRVPSGSSSKPRSPQRGKNHLRVESETSVSLVSQDMMNSWPMAQMDLVFCNSFMIMHVLTYFTPSFCTEYENSPC